MLRDIRVANIDLRLRVARSREGRSLDPRLSVDPLDPQVVQNGQLLGESILHAAPQELNLLLPGLLRGWEDGGASEKSFLGSIAGHTAIKSSVLLSLSVSLLHDLHVFEFIQFIPLVSCPG